MDQSYNKQTLHTPTWLCRDVFS